MSETLHIRKFGDKVKAMNAGAGKELKLTAQEARALHGAIYDLLEEMSRLADIRADKEDIVIEMDAGDNSLPFPTLK